MGLPLNGKWLISYQGLPQGHQIIRLSGRGASHFKGGFLFHNEYFLAKEFKGFLKGLCPNAVGNGIQIGCDKNAWLQCEKHENLTVYVKNWSISS